MDACTSCYTNGNLPFLYGQSCIDSCPDGHIPSILDGQTCVLIVEDVTPFVFLMLSAGVVLAIGVAKLCRQEVHFKNTLIGILTTVCKANWVWILVLLIKEGHSQSSVILGYAIGASYLLNLVFFLLYLKIMRKDAFYTAWRNTKKTRETILVFAALLTSFQLYRIAFQQLSKFTKLTSSKKQRSKEEAEQELKYADENTCKTIFNKLTVVMIGCVLLPVIVQNSYNLQFTHPGRQLFWEDVQSMAITLVLLFLMLFDAFKKTQKLDLKQIKPIDLE